MALIEDLPPEILTMILQYLSRACLSSWARVQSSWNEVALRELWSNQEVDIEDLPALAPFKVLSDNGATPDERFSLFLLRASQVTRLRWRESLRENVIFLVHRVLRMCKRRKLCPNLKSLRLESDDLKQALWMQSHADKVYRDSTFQNAMASIPEALLELPTFTVPSFSVKRYEVFPYDLLPRLRSLTHDGAMSYKAFQTLARLPYLEDLILDDDSFRGYEMGSPLVYPVCFPALQRLQLYVRGRIPHHGGFQDEDFRDVVLSLAEMPQLRQLRLAVSTRNDCNTYRFGTVPISTPSLQKLVEKHPFLNTLHITISKDEHVLQVTSLSHMIDLELWDPKVVLLSEMPSVSHRNLELLARGMPELESLRVFTIPRELKQVSLMILAVHCRKLKRLLIGMHGDVIQSAEDSITNTTLPFEQLRILKISPLFIEQTKINELAKHLAWACPTVTTFTSLVRPLEEIGSIEENIFPGRDVEGPEPVGPDQNDPADEREGFEDDGKESEDGETSQRRLKRLFFRMRGGT